MNFMKSTRRPGNRIRIWILALPTIVIIPLLVMDDLRDARAAAACSNAAAAPILKYLRLRRANHPTTNPLEVYRLTSKVLQHSTSKALSESDLWSVREDHVIACIQLGRTEEALSMLNLVTGRFPRSCRAARLKGMYLESVGRFDEARATYEAALRIDPDNLMINHRFAALRVGRGEIIQALEDLHNHLESHLGDYQGWYEAGKLHARQGAYAKAVFCFEEVLMHQPGDMQLTLTVADCLYACGGVENIWMARKYYASVVESSGGGNVKALLGVCQCCARLGEKGEEGEHVEDDQSASGAKTDSLGSLAAETLMSEYTVKGSIWAGSLATLLRE